MFKNIDMYGMLLLLLGEEVEVCAEEKGNTWMERIPSKMLLNA